jgi:hypothetical protein
MRPFLLAVVLSGLFDSVNAHAQFWTRGPSLIGVGMRVRVGVIEGPQRSSPFARPTQRLQGIVHAIAPETLYLDLSNAANTVAIPREAIRGVQMSTGRPSRLASAMDMGSGGALLFGLFLPSLVPHPERRFGPAWRPAAASVGIGFGVGAIVGALRPYEFWRVAWIPE